MDNFHPPSKNNGITTFTYNIFAGSAALVGPSGRPNQCCHCNLFGLHVVGTCQCRQNLVDASCASVVAPVVASWEGTDFWIRIKVQDCPVALVASPGKPNGLRLIEVLG